MADSESEILKVVVKASGDKNIEVETKASATISEFKAVIAEKSGIPVEQQRLIYSGRILKDPETVSSYKIKSGSALHLVKSAKPRRDTSPSSSSAASRGNNGAPPPSVMAAGQEASDPLSGLTGARYSGLANLPSASLFGPDGGQGPMPSLSDINSLLSENPELLDHAAQMISQSSGDEDSPLFRSMPPQAREEARAMMSSPEMRQLMSDPQRLRQFVEASIQMQQIMGSAGNPFGGLGPEAGDGAEAGRLGQNPFGFLGQGQGDFGAPGANPLAGMFGSPMPETDTRPPEERYENQLRQLNELGFVDFDRNVRALRRSGGNVEGAVEALVEGHV